MTKIRENLYLGHEFDAHMDAIAKNKITVSLNVANDLNDSIYPISKLICIKVGLSDDLTNPPELINLAQVTLKSLINQGHIVLVHCRAGMSRSPHILALYLAASEGVSYSKVWAELRKLRPEVADKSKLTV